MLVNIGEEVKMNANFNPKVTVRLYGHKINMDAKTMQRKI